MKLRVLLATGLAVVLGVTALASTAQAHIRLMLPVRSATNEMDQKGPPPCGTQRARNPQTFKPGESIMVTWRETVPHVGHFRVAFDDDGRDFPAPMTRKDTNTTLPIFIDGIDEKI